MSTKKKGILTVSGEWARHLRPYGRRQFWSTERIAVRQAIDAEIYRTDSNALATSFLEAPIANKDFTSKSMETEASPASILATRD